MFVIGITERVAGVLGFDTMAMKGSASVLW